MTTDRWNNQSIHPFIHNRRRYGTVRCCDATRCRCPSNHRWTIVTHSAAVYRYGTVRVLAPTVVSTRRGQRLLCVVLRAQPTPLPPYRRRTKGYTARVLVWQNCRRRKKKRSFLDAAFSREMIYGTVFKVSKVRVRVPVLRF